MNSGISTPKEENIFNEKERQIQECKRLLAETYQRENERYKKTGRSSIFGFGNNIPKDGGSSLLDRVFLK
ncbi:MAG: hypothetical protein HEEMFOPI_01898 [Holosporales bacterium]